MLTYCVGDIHGCMVQLNELILKVGNMNLTENRLIFLGDYIDRGPDSNKVIDYIMRLENMYGKDHIIALKGNHEDMCLHYHYKYEDHKNDYNLSRCWGLNGANETVDSYPNREITEEHLDWMLGLRVRYEDDNFHYVHAGFTPYDSMEDQDDYDLMWVRYDFITSEKDFGKVVVFGHTATKGEPLLKYDNKIGLDTACVYGYKLTCMLMETKEIWQVEGYK